jgi:membrane protein implicated in regulation of membrane protease activity
VFLLAAILLIVFYVPAEWAAPLIAGAVLVEIGWIWYWFRWTKRGRPKAGAESMVGERGEVTDDGWVRVQGELWKARGLDNLVPGQTVRVTGVDGLTLIVE